MLVQLGTDVDGSGLDGIEKHFYGEERSGKVVEGRERRTSNTRLLNVDEVRLKHALWSLEAFRADLDDTTIGKLQWGVSTQLQGEQSETHLVVLDEAGSLLAQPLVEVEVVTADGRSAPPRDHSRRGTHEV